MTRSPILAALALLLVAGCAKKPGSSVPHAEQALADWARSKLDLRTWRSCSRSAENLDLEEAVLVFEVTEEGSVSPLVLEPRDQASDAGMICLAMELNEPPTTVPTDGVARTVRLVARTVHELPGQEG